MYSLRLKGEIDRFIIVNDEGGYFSRCVTSLRSFIKFNIKAKNFCTLILRNSTMG